LILVLAILAIPTADLLAFGLHEHVMAPVMLGFDEVTAPPHAEAGTAHHCELWMNPGDVAPAFTPFRSAAGVNLGDGPQSARPVWHPFLPFTPPRSASISG